MKLRIRSGETKETLPIEAPDSSSLFDLKTLIVAKLSSSIRLSVNREDELVSSSPDDSLQSLGLTSGDLLFCSFDPDPQAQTLLPSPGVESPNPHSDPEPLQDPVSPTPNAVTENPDSYSDSVENPDRWKDGMQVDEVDNMEVEEEEPTAAAEKPPSIPGFLRRVLEEGKEALTSNINRLVVAVHAVFLESGFTAVGGDGYRQPGGWASAATNVSVQYTVPDLVGRTNGGDVKNANLRFMAMGKYATIYGYLSGDRPDSYRLCLDVKKLTPLLVSSTNATSKAEGELWKTVKDGLSLPLLIDICEENGLPLPPCFMRLPADLKTKILGLLPGVDVARVGSTCSELRRISSDDELWQQKYAEEFGLLKERGAAVSRCKERYAIAWSWCTKKNSEKRTDRGRVFGRQMKTYFPGAGYDPFAAEFEPPVIWFI